MEAFRRMRSQQAVKVWVFVFVLLLIRPFVTAYALPTTPTALYPIRVNGLWGYMDADGQVLIRPQYLKAEDFRGGTALVRKSDGYMLIDASGVQLLPHSEYFIDSTSNDEDGLYEIRNAADQEGYYDIRRGFYCPPAYDDLMLEFSTELIPYYHYGLVGYVRRSTGEVVIEPAYEPNDRILFFEEYASGDLLGGEDGGFIGCDIIHSSGEVIHLTENLRVAGPFCAGLAKYEDRNQIKAFRKEGKPWLYGLLNAWGQIILEPSYEWIGCASDGYIAVSPGDNLWGHMDLQGNIVVMPQFKAVFGDGEQYGYIFHNSMAVFELEDGSGIAIDEAGSTLFQVAAGSFDRLNDLMDNGCIWFERNWRYGLLNQQGQVLCEAVYTLPDDGWWDADMSFSEGMQAVGLNGMWGYLDEKANVHIPIQFDNAKNFRHGLAQVELEGKLAYIDKTGAFVWREP